MNEKHKKWLKLSFEEKRVGIPNFLINHTTSEVTPCGAEFAEIGYKFSRDFEDYEVFKITKNPAFDLTFIHYRKFKQ